ncbi:hypothetical protein [Streptomyces sp. NPDC051310]|uniref:hypothetical protein n=1 Tax=Streptomyces sp. NPDC051310 TaxID=3365649 RepID=UPI003798FA7E
MSRETDSSSSGPQGRGGAAYPSGTPPYGTRQYPSLHPTQDAPEESARAAAEPDEPRTETTLTTRIRINIPGSRPIPPVVMRKPMNGGGTTDTAPAPEEDAAPSAQPAAEPGRPEQPAPGRPAAQSAPGAQSGPPAQEKPTSDWFAPRKPPAPAPSPAPAAQTPPAPAGAAPRPRSSLEDLASMADAPGYGAGPAAPSGPTTGPATGTMGAVPRMSDDTAVLTPQKPAPEPGRGPGPEGRPGPGPDRSGYEPGYAQAPARTPAPGRAVPPPGGHVSGDTLTSGIPVVPADHRTPSPSPFPVTGPAQAAAHGEHEPLAPYPAADRPEPAPAPAPAAQSAPAAKKKGRSKLVLLGAAVFALAGVAYGAGLLLNHSEVPKGTTVLGVDVGGGTKEEAVQKLEAAFGERASEPLQLSVGGKKEQLAPDKAGLSLDSQETVRAAAGSDYNPVSVIGSLFGAERVAQPVFPVDEEKLGVALADLAGTSGSATEGTIRFEPNRAVAVPGKAGQALDVGRSMISVRDAYRAHVETGRQNVVELPVTTKQPTITEAELDRAMKEFAQPAMSGLVTIKAGGKQIQFGPARSLPKILSMKPVNGRLVEVYDRKAIDELLDGVFDGVMITKGDGQKHQVSSADVAHALQSALLGKTPAERTETIELDPQG